MRGRSGITAMRCSICSINYPTGMQVCQSCGSSLSPFADITPDEDWEEKVAALLDTGPLDADDKVERWRFGALMRAGYAPAESAELASRRDVDLHFAVELRAKTDLAYGILS